MTLTYGFYNSLAGDRKYNARQISSLFNGIIKDGVFASIGTAMVVTPGAGLTVLVGAGRAWFNSTWTDNDSPLSVVVIVPEAILKRLDTVVLEIDENDAARANTIKVIKGTPASSPVAPTLINTTVIHQYPLANVSVLPGATTFTAANITNRVGTVDCPFITGILATMSIDSIVAQWENEFDIWFNAMKGQLTTDAAGNLQTQLNAHDHAGGDGASIGTSALAPAAVTTPKMANGSVTNPILGDDSVDDIKAGVRVPAFVKRTGGDANDWSTPGNTNYTPGNVRMVGGATAVLIDTGASSAIATITFGRLFPYPPLLLMTLESLDFYGSFQVTLVAAQVHEGTASIRITADAAAPWPWNFKIHWLAIGAE